MGAKFDSLEPEMDFQSNCVIGGIGNGQANSGINFCTHNQQTHGHDYVYQTDFVSHNQKLHSRNLPYSSRHQHQRQNGVFLSHMTEHSRTSQLATLIIKSIGASFLLLMLAACGQDAAPTLLFIIHVGGSGGANCFSQTRERSFSYAQENISLPNISCGFSTL